MFSAYPSEAAEGRPRASRPGDAADRSYVDFYAALVTQGRSTASERIELCADTTGRQVTDLRCYLAFGAYPMAALFAKLFSFIAMAGRTRPMRASRAETQRKGK